MLVIVTCAAAKANHPAPAADIYTGSLYRMCMAYAKTIAHPDNIRIISARHGLLRLGDTVHPYDQRITAAGAITARQLRYQASEQGIIADRDVTALAPAAYVRLLRKVWPHLHAPLTGLRIGEQTHWLKQHTEATT